MIGVRQNYTFFLKMCVRTMIGVRQNYDLAQTIFRNPTLVFPRCASELLEGVCQNYVCGEIKGSVQDNVLSKKTLTNQNPIC